ncbi:hypothetical protein [Micromonospora sp. NPDC003241]
MTEAAARTAVTRWLRLVQADAELSAYLIGVDLDRLAAHLIRQLVGGGPVLEGWPGLPEASRRRAGDYLAGALATGGLSVIDEVATEFQAALAGRCPLPASELALVVAALARLVGGGGDRAERWALLAVLGRVHHRHRLRPEHGPLIGAALATVAPRLCPPPVDVGWESRWRRAWALVARAAGRMGDGPAFWPAEVVGRDLSAEGIAMLTVRPWHPLPFRPGQAVPLCLPQHPGRWRWYCTARPTPHVPTAPSSCTSARWPPAPSPAASSTRYAPATRFTSAHPSMSASACRLSRRRSLAGTCCWWPVAPGWPRCALWSSRSPPHRAAGG